MKKILSHPRATYFVKCLGGPGFDPLPVNQTSWTEHSSTQAYGEPIFNKYAYTDLRKSLLQKFEELS